MEVRAEVEKFTQAMMEVRVEVAKFAQAMEAELRENEHKGNWKDCELRFLTTKLMEEVEELALASQGYMIIENRSDVCKAAKAVQRINVHSEAADVGNIAMMIADICNAL